MSKFRPLSAILTFVLTLSGYVVADIEAATFSTANLDDAGTWNTVYVQGFRPSLDASPDPGFSAGDAVNLELFRFFKSGFADSASNIKLAILNNIYYDYNVQLTTSSGAFVGISSNTVASTAGLSENDPIDFSFSGLSLAYGSDYAAVFVNDDGLGNLTPIQVSALTENYVESAPSSGIFVPASNYGTNAEYNYTTSNFISGGFFSAFGDAGDAKFRAFFSAVPEPSTCLLAIAGLATLLVRRSAREL